MKLVFEGKVYELIPQNQGIVFPYRRGGDDQNALVCLKMLSTENGVMSDVAKNIYFISKFGTNYRASLELCSNYVLSRALVLPSGRVFLSSDNGNSYLIDGDGLPVWSGDFKYKGEVPSDIAIYKNSLWASYKTAGVLVRFNLNTMREELRIGGKNTPFNKPCHIFIEGNTAYVSNSGSNKLVKVNLNSYTVEDYKEFSEPIYSFVKVKGNQFVLLESGIYVL